MISTGTPVRSDRSLAAVSAPRRAERKTGLVELFAIIAIRIGFAPGVGAVPAAPSTVAPGAGFDFGQPAAARAASVGTISARASRRTAPVPPPLPPPFTLFLTLFFSPRQPSRRESGARLLQHHRDHD